MDKSQNKKNDEQTINKNDLIDVNFNKSPTGFRSFYDQITENNYAAVNNFAKYLENFPINPEDHIPINPNDNFLMNPANTSPSSSTLISFTAFFKMSLYHGSIKFIFNK